MARKNKDSEASERKQGTPTRYGNNRPAVRWINAYLDKTDLEWLALHDPDAFSVVGELLDNIPPTYTLSAKYDASADRYLAILFANDSGDSNANAAVTGRGSTSVDAWYALAYLVCVKFKWQFPDAAPETSGRWG